MSCETLGTNQVHLYFTRPDEVQDRELLDAYHELLSAEERARHERLRFDRHRHLFLVSHALVRASLSRHASVDPAEWCFRENEHGRPEIAGPADLQERASQLRFNLSHTEGLSVCAVTWQQDVGVDVERPSRRVDYMGIAERFYAAEEVRDLHSHADEARRRQRFFHYWTLKESYLKARGRGVSLGLARLALRLGDDRSLSVSFEPQLEDDPRQWYFALMEPTADHVAALALGLSDSLAPVDVRTAQVTPLAGEHRMTDLVTIASSRG